MKRNSAVRSRANPLPASHHPGGSWELLAWDLSISPCGELWSGSGSPRPIAVTLFAPKGSWACFQGCGEGRGRGPVPHSRVKLEGPDLSLRKVTGSQHENPHEGQQVLTLLFSASLQFRLQVWAISLPHRSSRCLLSVIYSLPINGPLGDFLTKCCYF